MKKIAILVILVLSMFAFNMKAYALETSAGDKILILDKKAANDIAKKNASKAKSEGDDFLEICSASSSTLAAFKMVGIVIFIAKIVAPIILIVMGMVDISRAVPEGKDDAIKKSFNNFLKRTVTAILIFFTPSILLVLFSFVDGFDDTKSEYSNCLNCLLKPGSCNANIVTNMGDSATGIDAGDGKQTK